MAKYIDQKEYLKKYLSGDKKAKKKKKIKNPKVKIIDEEIDDCADLDINQELLYMGEDAPQIVGVIDDTHQDPQFESSKWKAIGNKTDEMVENDGEKLKRDQEKSRSRNSPDRSNRRMKSRRDDKSPKRNRSVDLSPNRNYKNEEKSSVHNSTYVNKKTDYHNSTLVRKEQRNSDQSPKRRNHSASNRSTTHKYYSEQSNGKSSDEHRDEHRNDNRDSDNSPPRRSRKFQDKNLHNQYPVRNSSPTRITTSDRTHNDSSHISTVKDTGVLKRPARVGRPSRFSDYSPPRKIKVEDELPVKEIKEELSRPYRKSIDQSPRRRLTISDKKSTQQENSGANMDSSPNRRKRLNPFRDNSSQKNEDTNHKMTRTLEGKIAGLQDAKTLKAESVMLRAKEDLQFAKLSKTVSGRDAEVQVRKNRAYKNRRLDEIDEQEERQKDKREQQKKEVYSRWGKGLKQIEVQENKIANETHEGAKPLARYSNDEDLDHMLRQQERDGDPMLEYLRRKEKEKHKRKDNEMEIPKFQGSYPENRFNIRPGYRWDRLDRSNGYEKKWFDVQNQKKAMQEEAYKYSTEDL